MSASPVLIIKLSALGDLIQALGPCAAIRRHHPDAPITLLTTAPYADFCRQAPYFDNVWVDSRPRLTDLPALLSLARRLRTPRFARVYDLQTADRTTVYHWLMRRLDGGPAWSGIAPGSSLRHTNPQRTRLHTQERQADQLAVAGITNVPPTDLSWAQADLAPLFPGSDGHPPARFALLVPGGAPHRPDKRWPAAHYAALARHLVDRGITPLLLGTASEQTEAETIRRAVPETLSLLGRTSLEQLAVLGRKATLAVGNDTGPMHMLAMAGCPSLVLYAHASDPALCGQRGPSVEILRVPTLADLSPEGVIRHLPGVC